jgi:hypothetical protein
MTQTITREPATDESLLKARERVEQDLVFGRPWEDRSFEAVEASAGFAAGLAIGAAVGGPIGAAVGGLVGLTGGIAAGEALERAVGRAATTTDAGDQDPPTAL